MGLADPRGLIIAEIVREMLDKDAYDTVTTTRYTSGLMHLLRVAGSVTVRVGSVGAGNEALYDPEDDTIVIPAGSSPGLGTSVHELVHAHNDIVAGITDDFIDEGLAYAFRQFVFVAGDLKLLESSIAGHRSCDHIRTSLQTKWPSFWAQWGRVPGSGWGNASLHRGPSFPLLASDINNLTSIFGIQLKCSDIADVVNSIIGRRNCSCFSVTCEETSPEPTTFIPSGLLSPVFR